MSRKSFTKKILYTTVASTVILGGSSGVASAQNTGHPYDAENIHNAGGGLTNCNGEGVCIEKVGDEIEVSYEVQFNNIVKSSDHGQTARSSYIAFPSVIKDPKLEVVSTSIEHGDDSDFETAKKSNKDNPYPVHKFDKPIEVPTPSYDQMNGNALTDEENEKYYDIYDHTASNIGFTLDIGVEESDDDSYTPKRAGNSQNSFYATHVKGEEIVKDYKKYIEDENKKRREEGRKDLLEIRKYVEEDKVGSPDSWDDMNDHAHSRFYSASQLSAMGMMPVNSPYDYFMFNNDSLGVQTFRVTGKVKTESDLAYLPIRAKQGQWKCSREGGLGSYEEGCQSLAEYTWGRNLEYLPEYSLKNDEVTKRNIKNDTPSGLRGSLQCAVTQETGRNDWIGEDKPPRSLGNYSSWGDAYAHTFTLAANPSVEYFVGGFKSEEDGCDQAGVKIELCDKEDTKEDPSTTKPDDPVNKNDKDDTSTSDDPDKDNTINDKSDNTDDDKTNNTNKDINDNNKSNNVGKDNTDNNKTDNISNNSQQDKIKDHSSKDSSDKQKSQDKENTAQSDNFEPVQVNKELSVNNKSASQNVQKNTPRVITQDTTHGVNSVNSNSQGEEVEMVSTDGIKVNTGGEIEKNTFFSKVLSMFN